MILATKTASAHTVPTSASCETLLARYRESLRSDFEERDSLPQTEVPRDEWDCCGIWGPPAARYSEVSVPQGFDRVSWMRDRVLTVAQKYIGLAFIKSHIPEKGGFDCSNFTAWVYNYGLGAAFSSNVEAQSHFAGRRLEPGEPLAAGDLVFLWSREDPSRIGHVVIYVDEKTIIHSRIGYGVVKQAPYAGYFRRYAWARRIIE